MSTRHFAQAVAALIASEANNHAVLAPLVGRIHCELAPLNAPAPLVIVSTAESKPASYFSAPDDVAAIIEVAHWSPRDGDISAALDRDEALMQVLQNHELTVEGYANAYLQLQRRSEPAAKPTAIVMTSTWRITATGTNRRTA